jgi:hypothetical protein
MAAGSLFALEDLLSPAELTVRAQTIPPNDLGDLLWDSFFPRQDVDSVRLVDVTTLDYRPVGTRREWNTRGKAIPLPTPPRRLVNIVPIETNQKIDELEMQRLSETAGGNAATVREIVGVTLPRRTDTLAAACYRCLEFDAMSAWTAGKVTQKNPETGQT